MERVKKALKRAMGSKHRSHEARKALSGRVFKIFLAAAAFAPLSSCGNEAFFVSGSVAKQAGRMLLPLERLVKLKARLNSAIIERNQLVDEANKKVIKINEKLSQKAGILLEDYKRRERGEWISSPYRAVQQIRADVEDKRRAVHQIREEAAPLGKRIQGLKAQIQEAARSVEEQISASRKLNEPLPPLFIEALELVQSAARDERKARRAMNAHNGFVKEHNTYVLRIDRLDYRASALLPQFGRQRDLEDNLSEQRRFQSLQKEAIAKLQKARADELQKREEEGEKLQRALSLLRAVSVSASDKP